MKITEDVLAEAIKSYQDCIPIAEIADWIGVTRQGLWKAIRKAGIETKKGIATRRDVTCDNCGEIFSVTRSRFRQMGRTRYCSDVCYYMSKESDSSLLNRHKQRVARKKVSEVFDLQDSHVVHHADGDHYNTQLSNFLVFTDNADHVKYHHELRAVEAGKLEKTQTEPIWKGSDYRGVEPFSNMIGEAKREKKKFVEKAQKGDFRPYSKAAQLGKKG